MTHGRADVEAHLGYALPDMVWAILVDQGYEEDLDGAGDSGLSR